ncbi:Rieske 2Fe-2S domain-containing protein [Kitasatospora purpeofusca]|uniref:Rieske 2Fe-2S domain-containing protein n=1 Tax=Kitasatospora purpeofusca TaxID=67352 RepID=UPI0035DF0875
MLSREKNELLTRVGPGTPMGNLLRRYWHPVAPAGELRDQPVKPVRLLGEDLVLYRDRDGAHGLVERSCPHRRADLSQGWVERRGIRCAYHGWAFDETGACLEQPFEDTVDPEGRFRRKVRTTAYPTTELGGLIWAYLGPAPAPLLPRFEPFTWDRGFVQVVLSEIDCNWFQCQENSIDPVHFEWLHVNRSATQRRPDGDAAFGPRHVELTFDEFEFGFVCGRRTEDRADGSGLPWASVRTRPQSAGLVCLWPNALFTGNHFEWRVPVDDTKTLIITWWYSPRPTDLGPLVQDPVPYWYGPVLDPATARPLDRRPLNQDFAAWLGQGVIADRTVERLGRSDAGVIMLRQRFLDELGRLERGERLMGLRERDEGSPDTAVELPVHDRGRYALGVGREDFEADLAAKRKRFPDGSYYSFQEGQPAHVRRAYEEAMGIGPETPGVPFQGFFRGPQEPS